MVYLKVIRNHVVFKLSSKGITEKAEREKYDLAKISNFNNMLNDLEADDLQKLAEKYLGKIYLLGDLMPESEETNN